MPNRIDIFSSPSQQDLIRIVYSELEQISQPTTDQSARTHLPLMRCIRLLHDAGALTVVAQRKVLDPDFQAEYGSYYSRQFSDVNRLCTRLHFFKKAITKPSPLEFIDKAKTDDYLGFITLRPINQSPAGASILSASVGSRFIRSADNFPVHLMGREFTVFGTPFIQQDNSVGTCAQASIWMALRTLRKREGDKAYDPAQITDAATKYNVNGRIKPNRQGLNQTQIIEAIRAAGYSPHAIWMGEWRTSNVTKMPAEDVNRAMQIIHPYIESEIPVILLTQQNKTGHAIVVIGHSWDPSPSTISSIALPSDNDIKFAHAVSWIPDLIVNNDNTGPYVNLPQTSAGSGYSLDQTIWAMPLLPADVFKSGEEAMLAGTSVLDQYYQGLKGNFSKDEIKAFTESISIRLLLVEKRKIRKWAATTKMPFKMKRHLRLMDLPKRVWLMELHIKEQYGNHGSGNQATLIGFILIDATGDMPMSSVLMFYMDSNYTPYAGADSYFVLLDPKQGVSMSGVPIKSNGPLLPMRL